MLFLLFWVVQSVWRVLFCFFPREKGSFSVHFSNGYMSCYRLWLHFWIPNSPSNLQPEFKICFFQENTPPFSEDILVSTKKYVSLNQLRMWFFLFYLRFSNIKSEKFQMLGCFIAIFEMLDGWWCRLMITGLDKMNIIYIYIISFLNGVQPGED